MGNFKDIAIDNENGILTIIRVNNANQGILPLERTYTSPTENSPEYGVLSEWISFADEQKHNKIRVIDKTMGENYVINL